MPIVWSADDFNERKDDAVRPPIWIESKDGTLFPDGGGALLDVPKQYDTRTCAQRHDAELAELRAEVDELRRHVAMLERKVAQWEGDGKTD